MINIPLIYMINIPLIYDMHVIKDEHWTDDIGSVYDMYYVNLLNM